MNLVAILEASVGKFPDKDIIRFEGQSVTYRDFNQQTNQAAVIFSELGISQGKRVALMCHNTPGFIIAAFAVWRLGGVIVPVNHKLQMPEVRYILEHCSADLLLIDGSLGELAKHLPQSVPIMTTASSYAGFPYFDQLVHEQKNTDCGVMHTELPASDQIAEILYTSGTTGKPKGCLHTHQNVCIQTLMVTAAMALNCDDRMLIGMPIWHSSPLNNWTLSTVLMGGTVVLLREYDPLSFLEIIQAEKITATFCAPIALLAPLNRVNNFSDYDLSSVKKWIYGGGPLGEELAKKLISAYRSQEFYQVYGMTETGPQGTSLQPRDALRKAGSIGCGPNPGMQIRVDLDQNRVGEIYFKSPSMMQGYLNDPEATKAAFTSDGWYKTGDLVHVDDDGYMYIVDRTKDLIITGGENVYSKEVEDVLSAHPLIQDVAVIGVPHPEWGQTVTAVIVLKANATLSTADISTFLSGQIAHYKIPRNYFFRSALPRTATGKLLKHEIRLALNRESNC